MALSGVFVFIAKPSRLVCWLRASLFAIAVSTIYSPILVKAVRIYRIFKAGVKGTQRPRFTSSSVQVIFTGVLIGIQVRYSSHNRQLFKVSLSCFDQNNYYCIGLLINIKVMYK